MKITIYKMEQASIEFKKSHIVSVSPLPKDDGNGPKLTLEYLNDKLIYLNNKIDNSLKTVNDKIDRLTIVVENLAIEMRQGFAQINKRIDNLVSKNNLKE